MKDPLPAPPPRCLASIDLGALRHNASVCARLAGPRCGLLAIVKADAYGHGVREVAAALAGQVRGFGVANLREARKVREAARGACDLILVLSPATPEEIPCLVAEDFSGAVSLPAEVEAYAAAARALGKVAKLHAVADTGMGRMGSLPDRFVDLVGTIRHHPACHLEGVASHFPSADEDADFTRTQIGRFRELVDAAGAGACEIHLANSAGLIGFAGTIPYATLARPGLALYGVSPLPEAGVDLRPVMTLSTRVTLVREVPAGTGISYGRTYTTSAPTTIATLAAGYGDGYPRHLSGAGAEVLIHGKRRPLLGRVTMDQIVVAVPSDGSVRPGDEAILIGRQGSEEITAAEVAAKAGTIPWEILTGITSRVVREYRE